jgi:transcriptional regulator with XRE-family HTH domain
MHEISPPDIGPRLRALRKRRGLSLRALAKLCGLSANTISLVERGKTSPSVATLHRLVTALGVSMTFFFEKEKRRDVVFVKADRRARTRSDSVIMENLGSGLRDQAMEPLLVILQPGAGSGDEPIVHLGHEFVFCLEGGVEYEIRGDKYLLDAGDSLIFEARLPHRWRNVGDEPSAILLILQTQKGREESLEQHLQQI